MKTIRVVLKSGRIFEFVCDHWDASGGWIIYRHGAEIQGFVNLVEVEAAFDVNSGHVYGPDGTEMMGPKG